MSIYKYTYHTIKIKTHIEQAYEDSLKYYRDIKNVVDTSREEGKEEGREERNIQIAKQMKKEGFTNQQILKLTGISDDEISKW